LPRASLGECLRYGFRTAVMLSAVNSGFEGAFE
jgi:hypothetical protein